MGERIRLQKFLSNAGVASRRHAEELILQGAVTINGRLAQIGDKVDAGKDRVELRGKPIQPEAQAFYIAVNKPKGYISSRSDPQGRKSVYDLLPEELRNKVWTVGRLDFLTEGLLLFTNDGELTQALAHPRHEHEKEYEVGVDRPPARLQLDQLRAGVEIGEGERTHPARVRLQGGKVYMTIHEGKKRQIRRMFEAVGLKVENLRRIRVNKLLLGELPSGKFRLIRKSDVL
jgi:23S rRNA pseudouridine2605 synthase